MFLMACAAILECVGPAYIVHAHVVCDVCIIVYVWIVRICVYVTHAGQLDSILLCHTEQPY